jgi:hypothetical protein
MTDAGLVEDNASFCVDMSRVDELAPPKNLDGAAPDQSKSK